MPRTSNDAAAISALADPALAPYLPGPLPPHLPTELHVDAATVHGFDRIAPDAAISRVARERRARFVRRYRAADAHRAADAVQQHTNGAQ